MLILPSRRPVARLQRGQVGPLSAPFDERAPDIAQRFAGVRERRSPLAYLVGWYRSQILRVVSVLREVLGHSGFRRQQQV